MGPDAAWRMKAAGYLVFAALLVFVLLAMPSHPDSVGWGALGRAPLELPVILFAVIAFGRNWGVQLVIAALLVTVTFIKLADIGMFTAYDRSFNPILDTFLIKAGLGLLRDSIGMPLTVLAVAGAALATVLLFYILMQALRLWAEMSVPRLGRLVAAAGALAFAGLAVAKVGPEPDHWRFAQSLPGSAKTSALAFARVSQMRETALDLVQFRAAAAQDRYADATGLLDRLQGQDVIIIYIESYGRASFENPLYAPTHTTTLQAQLGPLQEAGFAVQSGWLTSPTAGGQSWLAHGTLSSGLWVSDNGRYSAMLASGNKSLFHIAQEAGFRTAAVMPAITLAWPESEAMGFDVILPAADIPYKGARFNWVTMPDQFTLATYPDLLPKDARSDFIQIALISSHAPWVPVPDMIPWEDVSDGTEFNEMAARGPTPRELWKNRDDVREAYRQAIDYSLQATFSYIARLGADAPLVFVLGDHQAAGFVAGSDNRDVPVHVVGPPEVVERLNGWGWQDGLVPGGPVRRMDRFRNDFIAAFSDETLAEAVE
ncbi:sulfatase-like hydrolase/transferase [Sulfitobacter sp.]|uniref:sulfatase-like hydrolase/transferase n=1 Tax=Sulfitobacter sp. TaxID=1903071 RepID=UPI003297245E